MASSTDIGNLAVEVASGDGFDIREFTVHERISTLFDVTLIALCDNANVDFEAIVGKPARFVLRTGQPDAPQRVWTGICSELQQIAVDEEGLSTYHLRIVPTLWLASQRRNYRMFQQIAEPDIVLQILSEWGVEPIVKIDKAAYKKRKYRVQYGESDYAFISRMLEDAGISFYFEQAGGEAKLVLADAPQSNEPRGQQIAFRDSPSTAGREYVTAVRVGRQIRPGKYTLRDHDYRRPPDYKLMASASATASSIEEQLERYHYTPGAFLFGTEKGESTPNADDKGKTRTDEAEAAILAQKRLDAKRSNAVSVTFETNAHDLAPGVVMSMLDHPRNDLGAGKRLLVIESSLSGTSDGEWSQHCEVRSAEAPFRPPLSTPKPKISGVESATVVGPPGEEIHTDEFGRVRVHFHWDRESKMDDNSSCWIHVSQPWAGPGFGGINLPRIGQEVIVDFLGGDPDRPIITGRMFTNLSKVPWNLPGNKTQSGFKSNSTTATGGYNEMMFEDAAGKELVRVQAEKDWNKLVKNDESAVVGHDRTRVVKNNESVTIGANRTKLVKANEDVTIGQNLTKLVKASEREVTGVNRNIVVGVNRSAQVGSIDSTIVGNTYSLMISPPGEGGGGGGGATSTVMQDKKIVLTTGAGATITMEGSTITIQAKNLFLFADDFLGAASWKETVVGGATKLTLGSAGGDVAINGGPMVKVNM